ncbi:FAD-dependent oxidoreductase (plasmid) [Sorangium sp. So ce119]|uniref:FAD-dependent oxidoreductase n=1 Tax=Sorangium sp. So ce119 TaxID=3133279 RepID=UPI003F616F33
MTEPRVTRGIQPQDLHAHMRVEDGLYVLGCLERRVTLHSQQIRALNLVYSLRELAIVSPGDAILIVGGGVAGLTAAAGAARLGFKVTLLEHAHELLHLQRNNMKRWIHPHIYDWPAAGSTEPAATVPLLRWKAAPAGEVVRQILDAYHVLPEDERERIDIHFGAEITDLGRGSDRLVTWHAERAHHRRASAVILAVGFGLERKVEGVDFHSYWQDDPLDQAPLNSLGRTLISGTGDGGLIDALRASVRDFRHDRMIEDLVGDPELDPVKKRLLAIEDEALAQERRRKDSGSVHLLEAYTKLAEDHAEVLSRTVDAKLKTLLRKDVTVVLNGRDPSPFSLGASILSRFLISRLHFGLNLQYRPGEFTLKKKLAGYEVRFKLGAPQDFDRVICRHGPSGALEPGFPEAWETCAGKLRNLADLDQTRWPIYGDAFRRAPIAGSGDPGSGAEPAEEAPAPRAAPGPTLATYLARIRETAGQVTLAGDVEARPLQDVFVELEVTRGGAVDGQERAEEDDRETSEPPGERQALHTELRRRKSAPWRRLTETIPAEDLLDFAHRTLIVGAAGTGKSTLLRWLACEAARHRESDAQGRIPVWLRSVPPHGDLEEDLAGALAKRAVAGVKLDEGPSEAHQAIREAITSGRALLLIDSLDESSMVEQEHAAEWMARLEGRVVLASRPLLGAAPVSDVVTVTLHGIPGIAAQQLLKRYFPGEAWVDGLIEEMRGLPDGQMWLETPVLLGLAATLYRSDRALPRATIELYRRAVDHLLRSKRLPLKYSGGALRKELQTFARDRLLPRGGAPRVIFESAEVPYGREELYKLTGLFTGGSRFRFTHLTLGEYLAAEADIDLQLERTKLLATPEQAPEGSSLEIVPMAHAIRGTAVLQDALAEARERDLSDHRLLRLLLRALGYGGQGVQQFCSTHAGEVIRLVAERLDAPSGRFGDAELALMDATERAFLAMRGLVDSVEVDRAFTRLLRLPGGVGTEAHVATWILGARVPERRESTWWPTVERQARVLVRANAGIEGILELTQGADTQYQGHAAGHLAKYRELHPRLRPLLYHDDDLVRRDLTQDLASDAGAEPDWRERLGDADRYTRERCVAELAGNLAHRTIYLPRLRYMLAHDPSDEVRAAVVDLLADDPPSRKVIRDILAVPLRYPLFSGFLKLRSAAIRALADDPESEELIRTYISTPEKFPYDKESTLQRLIGLPQWRRVLLQRLSSPDVRRDEVKVLAEVPEAEEPLSKLLDSPRGDIVHAAIEALGERADRSRLVRLIEHEDEQVRAAAITALGRYPSSEALIKPFLTRSPKERIAAAEAPIHDAASLVSIRDNLLRHPDGEVRMTAVTVLSAHPIAFAALREYFDETRSSPDIERDWGEMGRPGHYIDHGVIRAKILDALTGDPRYRGLVESSLDDPHSDVRAAAVRALAGDPAMTGRLQQQFYSRAHEYEEYDAFCERMSEHTFVRHHLLRCLNTDLRALRFSAFRYLIDHVADRERLKEMLSSTDTPDDWRTTMIGPLMRDPSSVDLVRALVDDESEHVREQALRLLRHDRRMRQELRERARRVEWIHEKALESRSPFYRSSLPSVLEGDPEAHPILATYLASDEEHVLAFVAPMLREYPPARPRLLELLDHSSVNVRGAAMRALGAYEPARSKIVAALAADPSLPRGSDTDMTYEIYRWRDLGTLRRAAADALEDTPELRTAFRALLDNEDKEVRRAAIRAVSGDRSPEAMRLLRDRLHMEEEEALRFQIIDALRADPESVDPLRDRLHNDHKRAVRTAAARALGAGDLSPAHAVRELPSVARARDALAGVTAPRLGPLQAFLKTPRCLDLDAESDLGEDVLAWACARLTWACELGREEGGQILGEIASPVERLSHPGSVIVIRVAMDAFSLPYERFLRPNHNLMEVWEIARHLVALDPPTVVLACADVSYEHLQPPRLEPGEIRFGPTFFGFRLNRSAPSSGAAGSGAAPLRASVERQ